LPRPDNRDIPSIPRWLGVRKGFSSNKPAREKSDLSSDAVRTAHGGPLLAGPILGQFSLAGASWM
jgi:hypothetical protein